MLSAASYFMSDSMNLFAINRPAIPEPSPKVNPRIWSFVFENFPKKNYGDAKSPSCIQPITFLEVADIAVFLTFTLAPPMTPSNFSVLMM
jgi:hypothetical protein